MWDKVLEARASRNVNDIKNAVKERIVLEIKHLINKKMADIA